MPLNEAEKARRNWLKWVVDFCNMDLGSGLNWRDEHCLIYTLDKLFYPRGDPEVIRERLFGGEPGPSHYAFPKTTNKIWERVVKIQGELKSFLDSIVTKGEKEIKEGNYKLSFWSISPEQAKFAPVLSSFVDGSCQAGYIPFIPTFFSKKNVVRHMLSHFSGKGDSPSPALRSFDEGDEVDKDQSERFDPSISIIQYYPLTMVADDFSFEVLDGENSDELPYYYLGWLFGLLDGASTQWIQKCKGCNLFFLNPTKKEKMYCNSSCASRSIVKKNRKELKEEYPEKYQAYLEKQREIMRTQYERKKKARLGPDATVKRRPRRRTT